jgi:NADH-quinone oxidoreductase subunit B
MPMSNLAGAAEPLVETYDTGTRSLSFDRISNKLADKGFIVAAVDDLITWARTGSMMWMQLGWPAAQSN